MLIIISLIASFLPASLYLYFIWKTDKNEPEPISFIILHFIWGAVGAVIVGAIGSFFITNSFAYSEFPDLLEAVISAPIAEEFAKGLFLLFTFRSKKFDNITDGLVYGGAIGLGFGMTENFIYFVTFDGLLKYWALLVVIRSSFTIIMHMISTSVVGSMIAMAKFTGGISKIYLIFAGYLTAVLIHGAWNFSVSFMETFYFGLIFITALTIFFVMFFRYSLAKEQLIIQKELLEEDIPDEHKLILISNKRFKRGWIDESIRRLYIKTAVGLAFNKHQYKISSGRQKDFYKSEIEKKRSILKNLTGEI
ncbi:PrsW family intramembrane metalloprotease [Melioribacter sp. Ez-97]|uniref:PrsW family intramembrane metalloprotease n=1 Tax=Melioribacter sp. Ez-97 TaxID=3423434 RepID=UPI003EDADE59